MARNRYLNGVPSARKQTQILNGWKDSLAKLELANAETPHLNLAQKCPDLLDEIEEVVQQMISILVWTEDFAESRRPDPLREIIEAIPTPEQTAQDVVVSKPVRIPVLEAKSETEPPPYAPALS
jgi:hypothetical protein